MYGNDPGVLNVWEYLSPGCRVGLDGKVLWSATTEWATWSRLTQVTVVPALTVIVAGVKAKFLMTT